MTTYGYCRVSTAEQAADEKTSLASQERQIRGAAMMRGEEDVIIFTDAGVSGALQLKERPQGKELMRQIGHGDTLIASKLDRLFRSASDALNQVEDFQRRGIDLVVSDMGRDSITGNGAARMFFGIMALVAEFERSRTLERTLEGRQRKNDGGGFIGGQPPFGFMVEGEGTKAVLVPNEDERKIIERAMDMRVLGLSLREIVKGLTEEGYVSRKDSPFSPTQVSRMLKTR